MRAICAGWKVAWVAWYKEDAWPISEKKLPELLPIDFYLLGKGFYIKDKHPLDKFNPKNSSAAGDASGGGISSASQPTKTPRKQLKTAPLKGGGQVVDKVEQNQHHHAAQAAYQKAQELINSANYDLIILDEINNAVNDQLITPQQVIQLLKIPNRPHLVLSGRDAHPDIIQQADLVSQINNIKHPYDQGIKAVKGLDF